MITLYTFGPAFGLPDPSPFVIKAEMLLKLSGLPYRKQRGSMRTAPKGKLPYIVDAGAQVPDSTLIRLYLAEQYGITLDASLSDADKAVAWSVECLCSDHLYWCVVHERWLDDAVFARGPGVFFQRVPFLLRGMVIRMIRRKVRGNLHGQGLGRFSTAERQRLLQLDIASLATLLADKPYMLGETPSWLDATVFAFVASALLATLGDTPSRQVVSQYPNLVDYVSRLRQQYFPEWQV
ncbi:glutathione S-transferase C-terminal domain-containing protein [Aquitalea sp. ASV11]|uniref:glutathione S-transferase C-terminal domain-containing protein n=1 Tax=Aquitalea sp. ASV11 TaxID=2795103 RepID=UPI0018EA3A41|nr:glutathione S-transferase C-terminal domain-containing protein [Aquitalea sp. ASV11]